MTLAYHRDHPGLVFSLMRVNFPSLNESLMVLQGVAGVVISKIVVSDCNIVPGANRCQFTPLRVRFSPVEPGENRVAFLL